MRNSSWQSEQRTRIASERTLMAWVRTAVSLIGFGFSIPKFFSYLAASEPLKGAPGVSPRVLGTSLIALGTLALVGGLVEHARLMRRMHPGVRVVSAAVLTACIMGVVGVLAFINVIST
jgi:putative membrane protein